MIYVLKNSEQIFFFPDNAGYLRWLRHMLTLEVNGQLIAWPEEFAVLMMKYYRKHGVHFIIHRNCVHTGSNGSDIVMESSCISKMFQTAESQEYIYCRQA